MTDELSQDLPLSQRPFGIEFGDVVHITLVSPLLYQPDEETGFDGKRHTVRLRVERVTALGLQGTGSEHDGRITPNPRDINDGDKITSEETPDFFPWSSILRMSLMYKSDVYDAKWAAIGE